MSTPEMVPEVSCRLARAFAIYFERQYGRARLEEAVARAGLGVPLSYVLDEKNWMSFELAMGFLDTLVEASGDEKFARKAGLDVANPEALGFAYHLLRAVGTPRAMYERIVGMGNAYNRVGAFTTRRVSDRDMLLAYTSTKRETNRNSCEVRIGQLAAFPTIWGLPPARLTEHHCQVDGAPECLYELSWTTLKKPWGPAFAGAAAGAGFGFVTFGGPMGQVEGAGLGAVLGAGLGLAFGYRRSMREKEAMLSEHSDGLALSMNELSAKVDEISRLNQTLEARVEERTRELAAAHAKVQAALDKQLELDRLKTQFFQNISHELRTPLTLILAPLDSIVTEEAVSTRAKLQLDVMRRSAVRLLSLINSLLDLSRLEAGKMRLSLEDVEPASLVRQHVENAQSLARQRGITLRYEGPESLPPVPFDLDKVEKSLLNLVSNALKFTGAEPGRAAEVVVSLATDEAARQLKLSVRDTGIGVPAAELENIFTRFHQVDGSDERRYGGTGIGLALVRELMQFHCGSVTVESTLGAGSTFTIALPLDRESYPPERLDRRRQRAEVVVDRRSLAERQKLEQLIANPADLALADLQPSDAQPVLEAPGALANRPRILVVDDNRDMLAYLATILAREYEVLTACDGEEAYETATRELPQVIVSDVMMPRKNGHALVRDLRRTPQTKSIPIILVTAKADVYQKVAGIEEGADDYLTKPFNFLELRARLRQLLRARSLERSLAEKNDYLSKLNFDLVLSKKEVFLQTIEALAFALEAKDQYTHGHSRRVSLLAESTARELSLSELEIERVRIAAVLHDIGKLGIPESILRKDGRLTPDEAAIIRTHPEIGFRILESVKDLSSVNRCILLHHEKFDGSGYPEARRAYDIPLESRIIAVADTYDAMTSDRPYRKGLGHQRAVEELKDFSGTQFDPECVKAFLRLYETRHPVFPDFPTLVAGRR